MKLDIELTPSQAARLREKAERLEVAPEELARAAVTDLLSERDQEFRVVADRLLQNTENCTPFLLDEPARYPIPILHPGFPMRAREPRLFTENNA